MTLSGPGRFQLAHNLRIQDILSHASSKKQIQITFILTQYLCQCSPAINHKSRSHTGLEGALQPAPTSTLIPQLTIHVFSTIKLTKARIKTSLYRGERLPYFLGRQH